MRKSAATAFLLACLPVLSGAAMQDPETPKVPAPDATARKDAAKLIRDVYKEDYAKSAPADRRALAVKLIDQGVATADNPSLRYALFDEAQDIAIDLHDLNLAMRAIDETDRFFKIDAPAVKSLALKSAGRRTSDPTEQMNLAWAWLDLALQACELDDYETASKATAAAAALAKRAKNDGLETRAKARADEVDALKTKYESMKRARQKLSSDPADAAANLAVGRFLCLLKSKWAEGLPFLAKGSDAALKSAAEKDIASPVDPSEQISVGDTWWDLAPKRADNEKPAVRRRAASWYRKALPELSGLSRVKVQKRLREVRPEEDALKTWATIDDPGMFEVAGSPAGILISPGADESRRAMATRLPSWAFDAVSVRVTLKPEKETAGGLVFDSAGYCAYVTNKDGKNLKDGKEVSFKVGHYDQKKWILDFESKCPPREGHVITVVLQDGEYVLHLNGTQMTTLETRSTAIAPFGLEASFGPVSFDRVQLRREKSR